MQRLCIYPKDVQLLTGKSERYGRYLLCRIRKKLRKKDHQVVTIPEFCDYLGLPVKKVEETLI